MHFATARTLRTYGLVRRCLSAAAIFALPACHGDAPNAPDLNSDLVVTADSPLLQYGAVDDATLASPTVVVRNAAGQPLANTRVSFTATDGALTRATGTVTTDASGRAVLPQWSARDVGVYAVDVRAGGSQPVRFSLTALPASIMRDEAARSCPFVDRRLPRFPFLGRTASRLKQGASLTVVALGSSSTFGTGLATQKLAYPHLLQRMLQRAYPNSTISVLNAGVPGHSSDQLDARLDRDVLSSSPDLVILQTGTNDALKQLPLDVVRANTRRTITRLRERGIDVVMLDPQRFRGAGESELYRSYVSAVGAVADSMGVGVARRYDWMTSVLDANRYGYNDLLTEDGLHQSELSHRCTAHLLATGIAIASLDRGR